LHRFIFVDRNHPPPPPLYLNDTTEGGLPMVRTLARRTLRIAVTLVLAGAASRAALADSPELASWLRNTTGATGYAGLPANVQQVRYSTGYVYINSSGIPGYTIGPWPGNPNIPTNQAYLFKIPRTPVVNAGTKTATPLGAVGAWITGVPVYNPLDAHSYNNANIWHQNAIAVEAPSFDVCLGHPAPGGRYHHHQNPTCEYTANPSQHSALLGYAFDGYPIYGPYAYAGADGTGGIARMRTGYRLRSITVRQTLPDGTVLTPSQYGPAVAGMYTLGYYVEDFEYVAGLGDLDAYNGRFAVTPEYPGGTYAYYVTIDAAGASAYPYSLGPSYNGVVATENITSMGHVTVSESVTTYTPATMPGSVPETITMARVSPTDVSVAWTASCSSAAQDYGIYEGTIGSWYSHTALVCTDALGDRTEQFTALGGNQYYLVVPRNATGEGSYGKATGNTEIPRGATTCAAAQVLDACTP
jgi:YHYH protein